jgi:hypothetical protein
MNAPSVELAENLNRSGGSEPISPTGSEGASGPNGMTPRQFRLLLAGLTITLFLSALDNTIVGTAMPTIVGELGGFARYT